MSAGGKRRRTSYLEAYSTSELASPIANVQRKFICFTLGIPNLKRNSWRAASRLSRRQAKPSIYVPARDVLKVAAETGATPYDVSDVEFTHVGDHCSFDTFIAKYKLTDPALLALA